MANTLRHRTQPADHLRRRRLEDDTGKPLTPVVAWSIVLLVSLALWCGLGLAASSLVSVL